tara:strand:- start:2932 stop:3246 length:315 start_codon:yes stop_codon:yes gene_type:complete
MKFNQEEFEILREISKNPQSSQRRIAGMLNISVGKINYCLKALRKKGLIKLQNFAKNPKKSNYLYILTARGISEKTKMTINFMQRKMQEYDDLKKDLDNQKKNS